VREVDINGDVYVRIAGREDVARTSLEGVTRDSEIIKLPTQIRRGLYERITNVDVIWCSREFDLDESFVRLTG